jgi:hypothetical protein
MRTDGIAMNVEGKPHPYGLFCHWIMQALLWTGYPIPIRSRPR